MYNNVNANNITALKAEAHLPPWLNISDCLNDLFAIGGDNQLLEEDLYSDDDNEEGSASIYEVQLAASPKSHLSSSAMHRPFLHFSSWVYASVF